MKLTRKTFEAFLILCCLLYVTACFSPGQPDPDEPPAEETLLFLNVSVDFSLINTETTEQTAFVYAFRKKNNSYSKTAMVRIDESGSYSLALDHIYFLTRGTTIHLVYLSQSGNYGIKTIYVLKDEDIESKQAQLDTVLLKPTGTVNVPVSLSGELTDIINLDKFIYTEIMGLYQDFEIEGFNYTNNIFIPSFQNNEITLTNVPEGIWPQAKFGFKDAKYENNPATTDVYNIEAISEQTTQLPVTELNYNLPVLNALDITSVSTTNVQVSGIGICSPDNETDCLFNPLQDETRYIDHTDYFLLQDEIIFTPHFSGDKSVTFSGTNIDTFSVDSGQNIVIPVTNGSVPTFQLEVTSNQSGTSHLYEYRLTADNTSLPARISLSYSYRGSSLISHQFSYTSQLLSESDINNLVDVDYSVDALTFNFSIASGARLYINGNLKQEQSSYEFTAGLQPGPNTINLTVLSSNGYDHIDYQIDIFRGSYIDTSLRSLQITGVELDFFGNEVDNYSTSISFDPAVTFYSVSTPDTDIISLKIITMLQSRGGTRVITLNGEIITRRDHEPVYSAPVENGYNIITTTVTAADGVSQKTYTIELYIGEAPPNSEGAF